MDFIQDYATMLPQFLPPTLLNPLLTFVTTTFGIFKTLQTHLTPLLTRLTTSPDLTSIFLLIVILFISFKILDMAYRAVMFWVRLAVKLAVWGAIAGVGFWIWSRGVDGFVDDVSGLAQHWSGEFERYKGEVKGFQNAKEDQIRTKQFNKGQGQWQPPKRARGRGSSGGWWS